MRLHDRNVSKRHYFGFYTFLKPATLTSQIVDDFLTWKSDIVKGLTTWTSHMVGVRVTDLHFPSRNKHNDNQYMSSYPTASRVT